MCRQGLLLSQRKSTNTFYSVSKLGCVIYHPNLLFNNTSVLGFVIFVQNVETQSDTDLHSFNIDDADDIQRVNMNDCVFEIKNKADNEAVINECAYNMFGAGKISYHDIPVGETCRASYLCYHVS